MKLLEISILLIGILLKLFLKLYIKEDSFLSLSYTTVESWLTVLESSALHQSQISIYSEDSVHMPPINLYIWMELSKKSYLFQIASFLILDALCLIILLELVDVATEVMKKQYSELKPFKKDVVEKSFHVNEIRKLICFSYCFNPFLLISFLSQSTVCLSNLLYLYIVLNLCKGNLKTTSTLCAVLAYIQMYPALLILPILAMARHKKQFLSTVSCFLVILISLIAVSFNADGMNYINNVYQHHFQMLDTNPQMNIYWYLMAEMFDHFRTFFKCTFQIIILVCTGGLNLRINKDPLFAVFMTHWLLIVLKPYPSIGEFGLILAMLPIFKHLILYVKGSVPVLVMTACVLCLAPLMHYLWLYSGSANANFYFAITLVFFGAQAHLLTSVLQSYFVFEFKVKHGVSVKMSDGTEGVLKAA